MSLDLEPAQFREVLQDASERVVRLYEGLEKRPVFHGKTPVDVRARFDEPLPEGSRDLASLLRDVEDDILETATLNISPRFLTYVMSGGTQAGIVADLIASALNQNCTKWHLGAGAAEMEKVVLRWIAEFVGYPKEAGGLLVSGGSMANLTCLAVARRAMARHDLSVDGLYGGPRMVAYTSDEVHHCHDKAMDLLGLGRRQLRKVPTRDDFTIDVEFLERQIEEDRATDLHPFCVIANGGTINTGAVDPLDALADLCRDRGIWLHVDAAFGGPAAASPLARGFFRGMERADSIALDPHKWLYTPFEVGCALVRSWSELRDTFSLIPDYLRHDVDKVGRTDFLEYGFQLSRSFRALKVWMTFKAYGARRLREAITDNIATMRYLADVIRGSEDFELVAPVPLSAVCFRYRTKDSRVHTDEVYLARLNKELLDAVENDGRVFLAGTSLRGKTVLRACSVNHRLERRHVEQLIAVVRELGSGVHSKLSAAQGPGAGRRKAKTRKP